MNYLREAIDTWRRDGDFEAYVIRIRNTGKANIKFSIDNPLHRIPIGLQIINKNMPVDFYLSSANLNTLTLVFTLDNADITLKVW